MAAPAGFVRSNVVPLLVLFAAATDPVPELAGGIGADFEIPLVSNPEVEAYLTTAQNRLVGLGNDVWDATRSTLIDSNNQGLGVRYAKEAITDQVGIESRRAALIARTEMTRAMNAGSVDQMKQIDVPDMMKTWLATDDDRTRQDHADADGQTVGINETFTVGGEEMSAPGDGSADQVCNCRCSLTYSLSTDTYVDAVTPPDGTPYLDPGATDDSAVLSTSDLPLVDDQPMTYAENRKFINWFHGNLPGAGFAGDIKADVANNLSEVLKRTVPREDALKMLHDLPGDSWWEMIGNENYGIVKDPYYGTFRALPVNDVDYLWSTNKVLDTTDAIYNDVSSKMVHQWAITSGDADTLSLAIQMAAKDEFNLSASKVIASEGYVIGVDSSAALRNAEILYKGNEATFRSFVRAQHDLTVAALKAKGFKYVEVYRGIKAYTPELKRALSGFKVGDTITGFTMQPASAFSYSSDQAATFGDFIIRGRVPIESIMGTARTGVGCFEEKEVVVLGVPGSYEVTANAYQGMYTKIPGWSPSQDYSWVK